MDAAQVVTEEVDIFAGLTFSQACEMLFAKCKSNAPFSEGFQNMIDYINSVFVSMGHEFSAEEYWNVNTISGSHEVFPRNLGESLNVVPEVLTREFLETMIERVGALETATSQYRVIHERVVTNARNPRSSGNGLIDSRTLTRSVNSAPLYIPPSNSGDDEDDFL